MRMKIIDADGHIVEKDKDIRTYLPGPYCKHRGSLMPSLSLDTSMEGRLGGLEGNNIPAASEI